MKKFDKIGLGGTFDRLHHGHELFLDIAAHYGHSIHIGLVTSNYLKERPKKFNKIIQNYIIRKKGVENHLLKREAIYFFSGIKTTGMDRELAFKSDLNALVTSQESVLASIKVNELRIKHDKPKLTLIITPNVIRETGVLESSTRLRSEEQEKNE